jgi:hypothetical protein
MKIIGLNEASTTMRERLGGNLGAGNVRFTTTSLASKRAAGTEELPSIPWKGALLVTR